MRAGVAQCERLTLAVAPDPPASTSGRSPAWTLTTSSAVSGLPSENLTPGRRVSVAAEPTVSVGVAGRAEFSFWQTELALSAYWRRDEPLKLGAPQFAPASSVLSAPELRVTTAPAG